MQADQPTEVIRRLRSAAGHLNAIVTMAEDDDSCEKVLHQLNAVEAALHMAAFRLVAWQLHQSEVMILTSPSESQRAAELRRVQALYMMFVRQSNHFSEVSE